MESPRAPHDRHILCKRPGVFYAVNNARQPHDREPRFMRTSDRKRAVSVRATAKRAAWPGRIGYGQTGP